MQSLETSNTSLKKDRRYAVPIFIACLVLIVWTGFGVGYTSDEGFYRTSGENNLVWFFKVVTQGTGAFHRDVISYHWSPADRHPPLPKMFIGLSMHIFGFALGPIAASRLASALFFVTILAAVYFWMAKEYGRPAGVIAALFVLLCPRVFGHAHIAALDIPMAAMTLLVTLAFVYGLKRPAYAILFGVALGLAFLTKINAIMLPFPLLLWGIIVKPKAALKTFAIGIPVAAVTMLVAWPWLWLNPLANAYDYFSWHSNHPWIGVYYFGKTYATPPAPWHYPFTMTGLTIPPTMLALLAVGAVAAFFDRSRLRISLLLLISALVPMIAISLPWSPVYDGVRLFLPAFPFMACLAGIGFVHLVRVVTQVLSRIKKRAVSRYAVPVALGLIVVIPATVSLARIHPYYLSYYNALIGGTRGAETAGMETTYWGDACNEQVLEYLNKNIPPRATILYYSMCFNMHAYDRMGCNNIRKDFHLISDLDLGGEKHTVADYIVLNCRRGTFNTLTWNLYLNRDPCFRPIKTFGVDGVPLIMIFERKDLGKTSAVPPDE